MEIALAAIPIRGFVVADADYRVLKLERISLLAAYCLRPAVDFVVVVVVAARAGVSL